MDNEAQKVYMVNCSKHFNVGQNFKLSNKISNLTETIPTSVNNIRPFPTSTETSPRPRSTWAHRKYEPDLEHHQKPNPRSPRPQTAHHRELPDLVHSNRDLSDLNHNYRDLPDLKQSNRDLPDLKQVKVSQRFTQTLMIANVQYSAVSPHLWQTINKNRYRPLINRNHSTSKPC